MRNSFVMRGTVVLAVCLIVSTGFLWTWNIDPEKAGVAATDVSLARVRGAEPQTTGPCASIGACTVNVKCALDKKGNCIIDYCTQKQEVGNVNAMQCQNNPSEPACTNVTRVGCFTSFIECNAGGGGCACTTVVPVGKAIGQYPGC
jgi:hypothetical protein